MDECTEHIFAPAGDVLPPAKQPPSALLEHVEEDGAERGGIVNGEDARQVTVRLKNIPIGLEASVAPAFRLAFGPRRQCATM